MFNPFFHPVRQALLNYAAAANGAVPTLFDSVQTYLITIEPTDSFDDRTITEVDLSRAVIFYEGFTTNSNSNYAFPRWYFTSSTNVRTTRGGALGGLYTYVRLFIVELPASQVNSIQPVEIQIPSGEAVGDATISSVNFDKSVILHCGQSCDSTENLPSNALTHLRFVDSTTVRAERATLGEGFNVVVNGMVLECK